MSFRFSFAQLVLMSSCMSFCKCYPVSRATGQSPTFDLYMFDLGKVDLHVYIFMLILFLINYFCIFKTALYVMSPLCSYDDEAEKITQYERIPIDAMTAVGIGKNHIS